MAKFEYGVEIKAGNIRLLKRDAELKTVVSTFTIAPSAVPGLMAALAVKHAVAFHEHAKRAEGGIEIARQPLKIIN